MLRETNCMWWSHLCRCGNLPLVLSGRKKSHSHAFELVTHAWCGEVVPVCRNCGVPLTVAHILVDCPCYGEAHHIYHLHDALSDMLSDDRCSTSNVLAFINAVGLSTSI
jgi:hypothetical protein